MLNLCPHITPGIEPDHLFAHQGTVIAAFCATCESGGWEFDAEHMAGWRQVEDDEAESLGIPLTVDCQDDACVLGR